MKKLVVLAALPLAIFYSVSCRASQDSAPAAAATAATDDEKTLYALGVILGNNLAKLHLSPAELTQVKKGLDDSAAGKPLSVDMAQYEPKVRNFAMGRTIGPEKDKGKAFADSAAQQQGAERTASGLVFQMLTPGTGASPSAASTVKVHYTGTLTDGKVFDSSVQRGQPVEFPLNGVIPCWTEGVQKMKVGGKARLVCPSEIAYGDGGRPPTIPGGATLVFEVELLDVKAPAAAK
jgi:FKBP-type peptidyl-prolyl cis-trans isomerase FkpA